MGERQNVCSKQKLGLVSNISAPPPYIPLQLHSFQIFIHSPNKGKTSLNQLPKQSSPISCPSLQSHLWLNKAGLQQRQCRAKALSKKQSTYLYHPLLPACHIFLALPILTGQRGTVIRNCTPFVSEALYLPGGEQLSLFSSAYCLCLWLLWP